MGNIEMHGRSVRVGGKRRFAMGAIGKVQMPRVLAQVAAQKHPEQPACHHKVRTVFLKNIALCPLPLVCRQRVPQAPYLRLRHVEHGAPDVHLITL
jgi:hypothetical protein